MENLKEQNHLKIAFVFAHPDDEHIPFGLPAELSLRGPEVYLISLTKGDLGSHKIRSRRKIAKIRKKEFEKSSQILGAKANFILGISDGEVNPVLKRPRLRLLKTLRKIDPDIVITQPNDYHLDHSKTGEMAKWATFHLKDAPIVTRKGFFRRRINPTRKDVAYYETDTQGSQTWQSTTKDLGNNEDHLNEVNTILPLSEEAISKSLQSFSAHESQLQTQAGNLSYPELALLGAQRRGKKEGFAYAVGLNFLNFGGYAFSTKNLLLKIFS